LALKETAGVAQRSLAFAKRQSPLFFSITTRRLLLMQIKSDSAVSRAVYDDDPVRRFDGKTNSAKFAIRMSRPSEQTPRSPETLKPELRLGICERVS